MWYSGGGSSEMLYVGSGRVLCSGSGGGSRNAVGGGARVGDGGGVSWGPFYLEALTAWVEWVGCGDNVVR